MRAQPDDPEAVLGAMAEASGLLAQMAEALTSFDPSRRQVIVPVDRAVAAESRVEDLPDGAIVVLDSGVIAALSSAAERIFQWSEHETLHQPISTLLVDADGQPAVAIARQPNGRLAVTVTPSVRGLRRDGTTFPVRLRLTDLTVEDHACVMLLVVDLSNRGQRGAEARQLEARYRALVEQLPAVTFMAALDQGNNEIYVSPQVEALLGYSQEEWLADPVLWFDRLHQDDRDLLNREFARGIATGGPFRAECRVIARDGSLVWIHGEARLVRDDAGKPLFLQGIAFDITESKRAAAAMLEAQELRIRTEKLAAIGQLAASVGHDLRNPLGAIRNAWYFIQRKLGGGGVMAETRVRAMSALIDRELGRCATIIEDLLDFTRERPLHRASCQLRALVDEAISVIDRPSERISLVNAVPADLPAPFLDAAQFRQVLVNLLQNATDAVDPNTGTVTVTASADEQVVTLSITDNGAGMSAEVQQRIFEPLFTTKLKGTGLGLAIIANIVKRHGGTISVESAEGRGSTFRVRVPLGAAPPSAR